MAQYMETGYSYSVKVLSLGSHYSSFEKGAVNHLNKLKYSLLNMPVAKFGWNCWLSKKFFLNFVEIFSLFRYYLHYENLVVCNLNNLFPGVYQVLLKKDQLFWRTNYFIFSTMYAKTTVYVAKAPLAISYTFFPTICYGWIAKFLCVIWKICISTRLWIPCKVYLYGFIKNHTIKNKKQKN
mgnify:CR=1 FL=1